MTLYDAIVKAPADVVVDTIDFTQFVLDVAPEAVNYVGNGDIGPTFTELSNVGGLIQLQIAGGNLGRTYLYGYQASTASGESQTITHRLRVRDTSVVSTLPVSIGLPDGAILLDGASILLDSDYLVLL